MNFTLFLPSHIFCGGIGLVDLLFEDGGNHIHKGGEAALHGGTADGGIVLPQIGTAAHTDREEFAGGAFRVPCGVVEQERMELLPLPDALLQGSDLPDLNADLVPANDPPYYIVLTADILSRYVVCPISRSFLRSSFFQLCCIFLTAHICLIE